MAAVLPTPLVAPIPDAIPAEMRALPRWAPWRAEWDAKGNKGKGKWNKIPHRPARPMYGLSNKDLSGWASFTEAFAAYQANINGPAMLDANGKRIVFGGVGYLMTGPHGVTGVDLDHCRNPQTGEIAPWAAEVIAKLDTYTEVSPSGTGLHAMISGQVPEDWANHDQGIEVYGGNQARFLCITGERVPGSPAAMRPAREGVFDTLAAKYRKAPTLAQVEDLHLPDLIPLEFLPELAELDLPPYASNFLTEGPEPGANRSQVLFATSIALCQSGLPPDEILSILAGNDFVMEVALDHRKQDYDKALRYLWKHHCQLGTARAAQIAEEGLAAFDVLEVVDRHASAERPATAPEIAAVWLDEADDVLGTPSTEEGVASMDDFDVIEDDGTMTAPTAKPEGRKLHFPLLTPEQFMLRKPMSWLVRGVLPRATLAVIYGASTAGKTFFTFDLVASIVRGVDWCGRRVSKGKGVYIVAEGSEGFRNRVHAYCEFHGIDPSALDIVIIPAAPALMDKAQVIELIKDLQTLGPLDFVVVDTYARTMVGGNENDAKDTSTMVSHCARIHKHTGALVILVHHSGKDPTTGARGSSVLKAAADVEIEVVRTKEYRAAKVAKMKDGDDSGEFRFNLPVLELGTNEDGDPITSCVVQYRDQGEAATEAKEVPKGAINHTVLAVVGDMELLDGPGSFNDTVEACVERLPLEEGKRDRRRELVVRAIERLESSGHLVLEGGTVGLAK